MNATAVTYHACPQNTATPYALRKKSIQTAEKRVPVIQRPYLREAVRSAVIELVRAQDARSTTAVIASRERVNPATVDRIKDRLLMQAHREAEAAKSCIRQAISLTRNDPTARGFLLEGLQLTREAGESAWSDSEAA